MFSALIKNYSKIAQSSSFLAPTSSRFFSAAKVANPQQLNTGKQAKKAPALKVALFSSQPYDRRSFDAVNEKYGFELIYHPAPLNAKAAALTEGVDAVCAFVNDAIDASVLKTMHEQGVKAVALRCAGFNNVDLEVAKLLGIEVSRVPAYSPEAVAEHAIALAMTLNRRTHKAFNRVREGNFALEGLLGFTLHGKTAGVVGTGKIGLATAKILKGFGCRVIAYDPYCSEEFKAIGTPVSLEELLKESDIVTLHCPLMPQTHHMFDDAAFKMMKKGAMLINTSRGGLVDTGAAIKALKSKHLGGLAIDVYEQESNLFFRDLSGDIIEDDVFERLMTFPNVLVTGHQGFFTQEALSEIAEVTLSNLSCLANNIPCGNALVHRGTKPVHTVGAAAEAAQKAKI